MRVGWMWQLSPKDQTLTDDVARAIRRYAEKYGRRPNRVHVSLDMAKDILTICGLLVLGDRMVNEGCIWLGREEDVDEEVYFRGENCHEATTD